MSKIPRIFFFVSGIGVGLLIFWMLQVGKVVREKPACEGLSLELDLMRLRVRELQLRVLHQDSVITLFKDLVNSPADTAE